MANLSKLPQWMGPAATLKTLLLVCILISTAAIQVVWHRSFDDLESADSLPHLANLATVDFHTRAFLDQPSLSRALDLLISIDPVHQPLTHLLTIPLIWATDRWFYAPWITVGILALLLLLATASLAKSYPGADPYMAAALLCSMPSFVGLTRYYNIDLPLTVWFMAIMLVIEKRPRWFYSAAAFWTLPLALLLGSWIKTAAGIYLFAGLLYGAVIHRKKPVIVGLLGLLIAGSALILALHCFVFLAGDSGLAPALAGLYQVTCTYFFDTWVNVALPKGSLAYVTTPAWYFPLFYPYYALKGLAVPGVVLFCCSLVLVVAKRHQRMLLLLGLIALLVVELSLIGIKKGDYLHPLTPLLAVFMTSAAGITRKKLLSALTFIAISWGAWVSWQSSFALPLAEDPIAGINLQDREYRGYYTLRPRSVSLAELPEVITKERGALALVDCADSSTPSARLLHYYWSMKHPKRRIATFARALHFQGKPLSALYAQAVVSFPPRVAIKNSAELRHILGVCLAQVGYQGSFKVDRYWRSRYRDNPDLVKLSLATKTAPDTDPTAWSEIGVAERVKSRQYGYGQLLSAVSYLQDLQAGLHICDKKTAGLQLLLASMQEISPKPITLLASASSLASQPVFAVLTASRASVYPLPALPCNLEPLADSYFVVPQSFIFPPRYGTAIWFFYKKPDIFRKDAFWTAFCPELSPLPEEAEIAGFIPRPSLFIPRHPALLKETEAGLDLLRKDLPQNSYHQRKACLQGLRAKYAGLFAGTGVFP